MKCEVNVKKLGRGEKKEVKKRKEEIAKRCMMTGSTHQTNPTLTAHVYIAWGGG